MATDSILKADKQKQIEELDLQISKEEKIRKKANELLDTYQEQLDPRVFQLAKGEINKNTNTNKQIPQIDAAKPKTIKKKVVKRKKLEEN